jgi:lysophospholipase L1-like esterase
MMLNKIKFNINFIKLFILFFLFLLPYFSIKVFAQTDSVKIYPFIKYPDNKLTGCDSSKTFDAFWQRFDSLLNYKNFQINFVHFGGSHLQADIHSNYMRKSLQLLDDSLTGSRGMVFPFKLADTNNPSNYEVSFTGSWKGHRSSVNSHKATWGVSGITATTNDSAVSIKYTFNKASIPVKFNKVRFFCNYANNNYDIQVANPAQLAGVKANSKDDFVLFRFKQPVDSLELYFFKTVSDSSLLEIYGVVLENDNPGFVYNAIGVNGASFGSYQKCQKFEQQLNYLHPDVAIISIGTNDSFDADFDTTKFEANYEQFIQKIKNHNSNCALLLTVPNDSYAKKKYHNKNTELTKRVIERVAQKYDAKVWDFFTIMGGDFSAKKWRDAGLMKEDLIHFTKEGYTLKGKLLFDAFMGEYFHYIEKHKYNKAIQE